MKKLILFFYILSLNAVVFAQCQASFSSSVNGGTVTFTNGSTGTNLNYSWTFGDGNNSTQISPSHTYTTTGAYVVCLTIYSNDSLNFCQDSYCDSIYVIADSTTGFGCNASASVGANPNGTIIGTNTSTGGSYYEWEVMNSNWMSLYTTTSNTLNYNPGASGNYNVCITAYDSLQMPCDSACYVVSIIDSTGGNSGCNLTSNVYTNGNGTIIGTASGASMYDWIVYDANWSYLYNTSSSNLSYNPGASGNYNVCLTAYDSLQQFCDSTCYLVIVQDSTTGSGCNVSASVTGNQNGTISGVASGAAWYSWNIFDANWTYVAGYNGSTFTHNVNSPGIYNVCLVPYDSLQGNCDTMCFVVATDSTAGLLNLNDFVLNAYPNPANNVITVHTPTEFVSELVLVDVSGSIVSREAVREENTQIQLITLPNGMYFIHALGREGQQLSSCKIIKQ